MGGNIKGVIQAMKRSELIKILAGLATGDNNDPDVVMFDLHSGTAFEIATAMYDPTSREIEITVE